jgi:hypothetical protein
MIFHKDKHLYHIKKMKFFIKKINKRKNKKINSIIVKCAQFILEKYEKLLL